MIQFNPGDSSSEIDLVQAQEISSVVEGEAKSRSHSQDSTLCSKNHVVCSVNFCVDLKSWKHPYMGCKAKATCFPIPFFLCWPTYSPLKLIPHLPRDLLVLLTRAAHTTLGQVLFWSFLPCPSSEHLLGQLLAPQPHPLFHACSGLSMRLTTCSTPQLPAPLAPKACSPTIIFRISYNLWTF